MGSPVSASKTWPSMEPISQTAIVTPASSDSVELSRTGTVPATPTGTSAVTANWPVSVVYRIGILGSFSDFQAASTSYSSYSTVRVNLPSLSAIADPTGFDASTLRMASPVVPWCQNSPWDGGGSTACTIARGTASREGMRITSPRIVTQ